MELHVERVIAAPIETVWSVITDIGAFATVLQRVWSTDGRDGRAAVRTGDTPSAGR